MSRDQAANSGRIELPLPVADSRRTGSEVLLYVAKGSDIGQLQNDPGAETKSLGQSFRLRQIPKLEPLFTCQGNSIAFHG